MNDLHLEANKQNGSHLSSNGQLAKDEDVSDEQQLLVSPKTSLIQMVGNRWKGETGLLAGKRSWGNVRTAKPFPLETGTLPSHRLFYFELLIKELPSDCTMYIGLSPPNFAMEDFFVGECPGSFAVDEEGTYWTADKYVDGFGGDDGGFGKDDVVGCGILFEAEHCRLFFTKNGKCFGTPIPFLPKTGKGFLFPTVTLEGHTSSVEANFGGDLKAKPYCYKLANLVMIEH